MLTPGFTAPTPTPHSDSGEFCDFVALPSPEEVDALRFEDNIVPNNNNNFPWKMPEPVHYTTDMKAIHTDFHSRMYTNTTVTNSDDDLSRSMVGSVTVGQSPSVTLRMEARRTNNLPMVSPDAAVDARNERRYRYLLEHEFNSSCEFVCFYIRMGANVSDGDSDAAAVGPYTHSDWRCGVLVEAKRWIRDVVQCDQAFQIGHESWAWTCIGVWKCIKGKYAS